MMNGTIDHIKYEATSITKSGIYIFTQRGQSKTRKKTCGQSLLIQWKDDTESWVPLKYLKESHSVEAAEYAKSHGISDETAFSWWVPYTLKKLDVILSAVKSRIRKTTHKYVIEIPTSVDHGHELDQKNRDSLWRDAIKLEMHNNGFGFQILEDNKRDPPGQSKVTGHLIFYSKMDFKRKARFVLDGHKTLDPIGATYYGVVSRELIRIAFTYAALNGLDVFAGDIRNAYLQAPSSQKDFMICGADFGLENISKVALIQRALYGGKSAGRDFRNHMR